MSDWTVWLVIAGVVVVLELFTGTFYLLMIALGLFAGAMAAFLGCSMVLQIISAALVGSVATISLRRSKFGSTHKVDAARDPNVNLDIGQSIQVNDWSSNAHGTYQSRTMYRGAQWDVQCSSKVAPQAGMFKIVEIRGSLLLVEPLKSHP
ncbi:membrane protein implicated in regulation of membrane protease activity [Oxalobacteraceae bacterium GrIS 2.11]